MHALIAYIREMHAVDACICILHMYIWFTNLPTHSNILGNTDAHVPHAMSKCNCKTYLEINEQGYTWQLNCLYV